MKSNTSQSVKNFSDQTLQPELDINYPSIFNDVIGPVMRGPSSSHCAASVRIGRIARDLMDGNLQNVLIEFDPNGSLATTHASQGSDMGLFGGFMGWDAADDRLVNSHIAIKEVGINIEIKIISYGAKHPNTYKFTLKNTKETHEMIAISTGGGMVEVLSIDGFNISMMGGYFETLIFINENADNLLAYLKQNIFHDDILFHERSTGFCIQIRAHSFLNASQISKIKDEYTIDCIKQISPVLPILNNKESNIPFITCDKMLEYNANKNLSLWELALHYESARGNISHDEVKEKMLDIIQIMQKSINEGVKGTEYEDRIYACQSVNFKKMMENKSLVDGDILNTIILYVTAMMEIKSSMGVIVAAPTAGSCGALPGAVLAVSTALNLSEEETVKAMLTAGLIGVFITAHATFAAEVGGCQAECGSGAGMAAAAIVQMAGGTIDQSLTASSIALQNSLGMICDPIANRVEAPCLGKNVLAATNALSCANMALADYDHLIPLDEVIETMDKVGQSIPTQLRCTALGGLSVTETSKKIEGRLAQPGSESANNIIRFKSC